MVPPPSSYLIAHEQPNMKYTTDTKITRTDQFVETEIEGEIVLMNHESGKFYTMAGTAARTWQLIQDGIRLKDIVVALSREYEVKPQRCLEDIQSVIGDLERGGLVVIDNNEST
jgi:hypothetical protein